MIKPDKVITGKAGEPLKTDEIKQWLKQYPNGAVTVTIKKTGKKFIIKNNALGEIVFSELM